MQLRALHHLPVPLTLWCQSLHLHQRSKHPAAAVKVVLRRDHQLLCAGPGLHRCSLSLHPGHAQAPAQEIRESHQDPCLFPLRRDKHKAILSLRGLAHRLAHMWLQRRRRAPLPPLAVRRHQLPRQHLLRHDHMQELQLLLPTRSRQLCLSLSEAIAPLGSRFRPAHPLAPA